MQKSWSDKSPPFMREDKYLQMMDKKDPLFFRKRNGSNKLLKPKFVKSLVIQQCK